MATPTRPTTQAGEPDRARRTSSAQTLLRARAPVAGCSRRTRSSSSGTSRSGRPGASAAACRASGCGPVVSARNAASAESSGLSMQPPGSAAACTAGGPGWWSPARGAGRPGLVLSRMKGSWSRGSGWGGSPCSQPPLTWRGPVMDPWPPSRRPSAGLALTCGVPGSDLAPEGGIPVPDRSRAGPARLGHIRRRPAVSRPGPDERYTPGTRAVVTAPAPIRQPQVFSGRVECRPPRRHSRGAWLFRGGA